MKIKKELIKREIGGETILVPVGKTVYDSKGLFVINELGTFIWEMLPKAGTEEDILNAILSEYDVSEDEAKKDLEEFLDTLRKMEII